MTDLTQNPYVGPRPFERDDQDRFFGRDREANDLLSLIVANRVVVLYAQSGAGKTSLLNAQVAPLLEAEEFEVWPFARLQGPDLGDINAAEIKNIYTFYSLLSWSGEETDLSRLTGKSIRQFLAEQPQEEDEFGYTLPRVLIFDQFEELFTAFPARWQEREAFFNQISRALTEDPLLRVVFSLREDYIAQLDPYAHLMPHNLRTRFRLERMRGDAALEAIRSPIANTNRKFAPGVAEQLMEDLRTVRVETMTGEITTVTGEFIEPVQLQVVCQNLWEDLPEEVAEITAVHQQTFGNVDQALSAFYERAVARALPESGMKEEELRRWFEEALITPAGTRGTVYRGSETTGDLPNTAVDILENMHIIRGEIRAGSRWYELTHDRLIEPIRQSNGFEQDKGQQDRIRRIRQRGIIAVITVAFIGLCISGFIFTKAQSKAAQAAREVSETAQAEALYAQATAQAGALYAQATAQANLDLAVSQQETAVAAEAAALEAAHATATQERIIIETAAAETAVAIETVQAEATATAIARATIDAEATRTAAELERLSQPVRPVHPGISIGNQDSATAGTLGAFVVDDQGEFYLVGTNVVLGDAGAPILQPSPIDGGKLENAVGVASGRLALAELPTLISPQLLNLANLEPGISFQATIPGVGPVIGSRDPILGETVWVYGRTSGLSQRQISCVEDCQSITPGQPPINADFLLDAPLSSGDEGALVIDSEGLALGMIASVTTETSIGASISSILDLFDVELVTLGQQVAQYDIGNIGVYRPLAFAPVGDSFAVTDFQNIQIIDIDQSELDLQIMEGHNSWVSAVAYSPDGTVLASADVDGNIRLTNVSDPSDTRLLRKDDDETVWSVAFSPDGQWLASGGLDRTVLLWDMASPEEDPILVERLNHNIYSVTFSPDGERLLVGDGEGHIRIWEMDELEAGSTVFQEQEGTIFSLDFSADGNILVSGDSEGEVLIWNFSDLTQSPRELEGEGVALAISPDDKWLATGGLDGTVYLWDFTELDAVPQTLTGQTALINALAFSPDGRFLASNSIDGTLNLWLVR